MGPFILYFENYADKAQMISSSKLVAFGTGKKYCLLNKYNDKVYYIGRVDNRGFNALDKIIKTAKKENIPVYLIVKKSKKYPSEIMNKFKKIEDGTKYDLYMDMK